MKPKYAFGETVKIKSTGEKVIINYIDKKAFDDGSEPYMVKNGFWYMESELKPYRPSRMGMYRDLWGRFCKKNDYFIDDSDSKQRNYQKIKKLERVEYVIWGDKMCNKVNEIIDHIHAIEEKI